MHFCACFYVYFPQFHWQRKIETSTVYTGFSTEQLFSAAQKWLEIKKNAKSQGVFHKRTGYSTMVIAILCLFIPVYKLGILWKICYFFNPRNGFFSTYREDEKRDAQSSLPEAVGLSEMSAKSPESASKNACAPTIAALSPQSERGGQKNST